MKKKRSITLIEIMIVIFLIGIIGGTLAFNLRGSMDQGRAFKTEQAIARVHDILMLDYASTDRDLKTIVDIWPDIIKQSPLVKNKGNDLLVDGWKEPLKVTINAEGDDLVVRSKRLEQFKSKHGSAKS